MKKVAIVIVCGIIAACMIGAAGSGTKAEENEKVEALKAESVTVKEADMKTGNILMDADIYEVDVLNALNEVIGVRGEIKITKQAMKTVTNEQYREFAEKEVAGNGYNWFTIFFEDNTGICFEGALSYCATYGTVDYDGTIIEAEGMIALGSDGEYSYTAIEE